MPNETISQNDTDRLTVQWGKPGEDLDPAIILTSWRQWESPDGQDGEWRPASAWDLGPDTADHLIRTLRKAREQAYGDPSPVDVNIQVHVHGDGPDSGMLHRAVRNEVLRYQRLGTQ